MQPARSLQAEPSNEGAIQMLWQSAATPCALCGGRRRDHLFVVGQARMTRCHECSLVSRTGGEDVPVQARSHRLDALSERRLRGLLPADAGAMRVLQISMGGEQAWLNDEAGRTSVRLTLPDEAGALALQAGSGFDAVFLNGALEYTGDPVALLRGARAALRPGGVLIAVVDAADADRLPADGARLPQHLYSPATLLRLAQVAGLQPRRCGLLTRDFDRRLDRAAPLRSIHALISMFGGHSDVSSGLYHLVAAAAPTALRASPKLSIIMPVFNEVSTFRQTFDRVAAARIEGLEREIIVVESNSTDGSRQRVQEIENEEGVHVIYEDGPRGKGHAVRAGLAASTGDIVLIQDADSEYDVADYDILLEPLLRLSATFVLGSRHLGSRTWKIRQFDNKALGGVMNLAHEFFTVLVNWLYRSEMRDPTTMYKVFRRECIEGIAWKRDRFDFDFELVCKLLRRGHVPLEVPINYRSRSFAEGKKVRFFRDPITWLRAIIGSRFEPLG